MKRHRRDQPVKRSTYEKLCQDAEQVFADQVRTFVTGEMNDQKVGKFLGQKPENPVKAPPRTKSPSSSESETEEIQKQVEFIEGPIVTDTGTGHELLTTHKPVGVSSSQESRASSSGDKNEGKTEGEFQTADGRSGGSTHKPVGAQSSQAP